MEEYIMKINERANDKKVLPTLKGPQRGYVPLSLIIFRKYDLDGDGALSLAEFKSFTQDKGYFLSTTELVTAFAYACTSCLYGFYFLFSPVLL